MRLLLGPEPFTPVFDSAQHRLFHLETRDDYLAANEDTALARWKTDETADPRAATFGTWADLVARQAGRGVVMQRARIITEPHTTYTRYLLALAEYNVAAGEDVRYLPRHQAGVVDSVSEDFWLIDDTAAAVSLFDENNYWVGAALTDNPAILAHLAEIRDRVWAAATPWKEYAHTP